MADWLGAAMLGLIRASGPLATPVLGQVLRRRLAAGKEHALRWREKLGEPSAARPDGRLVWIHAASVGETNSILPLVAELRRRGAEVLVTTGTVTSAEIAAQRLPPGVLHQFAPLDARPVVARFLAHWRPDLALIVESEIWPSLYAELAAAGIPFHLVNGRFSVRAARGWSRVAPLARAILALPASILAQTEDDAARFRALGGRDVRALGNLKFDAAAPGCNADDLAALTALTAARPVWIAASTHPGEEELAGAAELALRDRRALLVSVPRHPERGEAVAALYARLGLAVARRSKGELPGPGTDVYVADTLGELGLFYRLAGVAFVGGTFVDVGGQNPIEPALLGRAIVHGPLFAKAAEIYGALDAAGGAVLAADGAALKEIVAALIDDAPRRAEIAAASARVVSGSTGALARTLDALGPDLARLGLDTGAP